MATAQPGMPRPLVGTVLSRRWRLTSKLGEGGMGEVYAADSMAGGPRVAVKVLRPEFVSDPQVLSRFLEEARTSIRLVHPNIVRVIEGSQAEDGSPYLVMELLDGVPLGAYTQNGGRVPLAQAVPILQGILAGLAAAHSQGVVHRDLKPDNVLLTRDAGGTFVVKVLDFGIAKVMDVAGGMGVRTRTGMLLGTPAYMSPEQARNARDVDQRADLWSAGVLFYEMLTGRSAFPAPTEYARLAALLSSEPEPVTKVDPSLAPLTGFFERALKKDRAERFSTAIEMARALSAAVPGIGGRASGSPAPLSQLPDVPSLFGPVFGSPTTAASPGGLESRAVPMTAEMPTQEISGTQPRAGGTLASQAASPVVDAPPNVALVQPKSSFGETLPSKDGRRASRNPDARRSRAGLGVGVGLVVVLVLAALVAGFVLGWLVGRM
ncbi:MAG TPA: protein kinase [Polyangiaceae bacterium]|jgi:serine/threonine-protein kinase|nr:protein kinase [Polyangiaceae bacterium]